MKKLLYLSFLIVAQHVLGQGITDQFDLKLRAIVEANNYPGALAAYRFSNGEAGIAYAGYADIENKVLMEGDHRMLAGSVGKTFVSAIILMYEKSGQLSFDDKISKYFAGEDWFERLPNGRDITISHLLSHSAGINDHVQSEAFVLALQGRMADPESPPDFVFTPVELIAFILDQDPLFAAGNGYSYTDTGYIILGLLIEKISGQKYYEVLEENILRPLKLSLTSPSNALTLDRLSSGYLDENNPLGLPTKISEGGRLAFNPGTEWTGGGLISNPLDLVRWASILYGGELMEATYLDDLIQPDRTDEKDYYGYGVQVRNSEYGVTYGHGGWFPGYRTQMVYFNEIGLAIAIQINTDVRVSMREAVMGLMEVLVD